MTKVSIRQKWYPPFKFSLRYKIENVRPFPPWQKSLRPNFSKLWIFNIKNFRRSQNLHALFNFNFWKAISRTGPNYFLNIEKNRWLNNLFFLRFIFKFSFDFRIFTIKIWRKLYSNIPSWFIDPILNIRFSYKINLVPITGFLYIINGNTYIHGHGNHKRKKGGQSIMPFPPPPSRRDKPKIV